MSKTASPQTASRQYLRIDTDHHVLSMMQQAVSRLQTGHVSIQLQTNGVLLTGSVESWHDKQFAQESIREISGPRVIRNDLVVQQY